MGTNEVRGPVASTRSRSPQLSLEFISHLSSSVFTPAKIEGTRDGRARAT